mgnify:CR=1 FL=1
MTTPDPRAWAQAAVRAYDLSTCRALAEKAVNCATPAEVRALVPVDEF